MKFPNIFTIRRPPPSTRNIIQVLFPTRWKANTARAEIVFKFDFKQNSRWTLLFRFKFKCNITQRKTCPTICNIHFTHEFIIHPKSKKVCGFCFSGHKNLRKKCVNPHDKTSRQKCVNQSNSMIFYKKRVYIFQKHIILINLAYTIVNWRLRQLLSIILSRRAVMAPPLEAS